jgi:hypothetical protein
LANPSHRGSHSAPGSSLRLSIPIHSSPVAPPMCPVHCPAAAVCRHGLTAPAFHRRRSPGSTISCPAPWMVHTARSPQPPSTYWLCRHFSTDLPLVLSPPTQVNKAITVCALY